MRRREAPLSGSGLPEAVDPVVAHETARLSPRLEEVQVGHRLADREAELVGVELPSLPTEPVRPRPMSIRRAIQTSSCRIM